MKKRTSKEVEKCLINVMNKINDGEITNTNNVLTEFHLGMRYGTAMLKLKLIEKIGNKYSYTNNKPISMETAKLIRKTANEIEYENKETRFSETKPKLPKSPTIEEDVKNDIKSIILNNRRFEFLQSLENGIYNEAIKKNTFKIL